MFKKLISSAALTIALALTAMNVNAALITQDIVFDDFQTDEVEFETIGSLTINTSDDDGTGLVFGWENFELLGFNMLTEAEADLIDPILFGGFVAGFNPSDLYAGIDFAQFDVTENVFGFYAFNGLVDQIGSGYLIDVFDFTGGLYVFGEIAFANTTVVPEPSAIALLLVGLLGLRLRKTV